jgi:hypothetical protein
MKPKTNPHMFNNVCPIRQDPQYIPIRAMDLLMLLREMFMLYYERDKEVTGRAKTRNGKATENFKKFC